MTARQLDICIIGMGPRGLSVLERLCANARAEGADVPTTVHVVEPHPPGAGQVWRTDQPHQLLMNTVSSQVTMFTDDTVDMAGPLQLGPSLYEWARFLVLMGPFEGWQYPEHVMAEAARLGPDSYPTRAFYGHYLEWVFHRVVTTAPDHVTIRVHRSRAVALDDAPAASGSPASAASSPGPRAPGATGPGDGGQTVLLADGERLTGLDAVVLALGHLPTEDSEREAALAAFAEEWGLVYLAPANPADTDLDRIRPGEPVVLLGLGLNFFDYMALLTVGRGGSFERAPDGLLRYRPSGREPLLHAGSRRGLPFHSRGENEKGAHGRHLPIVLVPEVIDTLRDRSAGRGGLDFRAEVWPLIAKEVETVYCTSLLAADGRADEVDGFRERYLATGWGSAEETALIDAAGLGGERRWDWERIARPYGDREFAGPDDFRDWLADYLRQDLTEARLGNVSGPLKAALDVLRDLRNEVRMLVDHGGLTGTSHHEDLDQWYTPLNAFLSIGPPAHRIEEALALLAAGVLTVLGPRVRAVADPQSCLFRAESAAVPGSEVSSAVLIDARLPDIDVRRTADPLLGYLLATGQCRPYEIGDPGGTTHQTGGVAVTARPYHLVDAEDHPHPKRFAFGVPTEAVHWVTAAGIRPGVNSVTLTDADAIARTVLGLAAAPLPAVSAAGAAAQSPASTRATV